MRRFWIAAAVLLAALIVSVVGAPQAGGQAATPRARLVNAFPGQAFSRPVGISQMGDGRLFIVEQAGRIEVLRGLGAAATRRTFLDIRERVQTGGERGLLGLAFHPDYSANGYFYVNYTRDTAGQLETVIARFQVSADPDVADATSEQVLLVVAQPYGNHNGGDLHFDPQGYLLAGLGDGGSANDPENRAQDGGTLLGKLLRLDVDRTENGRAYAIPPDNPFVGQAARDEIYALGLRNPWRFSFDRATGDLYVADVGQNAWEEINYRPAGQIGGENYGWRLKEGLVCFNPPSGCDPGGLTDPVYVYSHDAGCSVTGGVVYRGTAVPALNGVYLYADYCRMELFGLWRDGQGRWQSGVVAPGAPRITAFGEDAAGEVYLASLDTGEIYRLEARGPEQYLPLVRG